MFIISTITIRWEFYITVSDCLPSVVMNMQYRNCYFLGLKSCSLSWFSRFVGVPSPKWGLKKPCKSCRSVSTTQAPKSKTPVTTVTKATSNFTTLSPTVAHTTQPQTTAESTTPAPAVVSTNPATLFTTSMYLVLDQCVPFAIFIRCGRNIFINQS